MIALARCCRSCGSNGGAGLIGSLRRALPRSTVTSANWNGGGRAGGRQSGSRAARSEASSMQHAASANGSYARPDPKARRRCGQPAYRLGGFLALTEAGAAQCEDTVGKGEVPVALYCLARVSHGLLKPAGQKASQGEGECRMINKRLQRTEVNRLFGMLDGFVWRAETSRQRVNRLYERGPSWSRDRRREGQSIAGQGGTHSSCHHERKRDLGTAGDRLPSEALGCLPVVVLRARPIHQVTLLAAPRRKSVGGRIVPIPFQRQVQ